MIRHLVEWHPDITPGEPFKIPAHVIVPCEPFWRHAVHLVEEADKNEACWLYSLSFEPWNEHLARHWVYEQGRSAGDEKVWFDEDSNATQRWRYLGVYTPWGLAPNDWKTGVLTFTPA